MTPAIPDVLTLTAANLKTLLEDGAVSTVHLVELYLAQIEQHSHHGAKLNAIISTARCTAVMELARQLDNERAQKKLRGPMHGIPIIIKDVYLTPSFGMETTCGSFALKGQVASRDAVAVELLMKAGMIIIAKANSSEWGSYKASNITCAWSAVGGQTQSPYVRGGVQYPTPFLGHSTPAGSSSGSAVGVAAGFAPASLGAETNGSVVQPATRAALYGLRATYASIDVAGVQPGAASFDCLGGFAKTLEDFAYVMSILMKGRDFSASLDPPWKGVSIGFVDARLWKFPNEVCESNAGFRQQMESEIDEAITKISTTDARVVNTVDLVQFWDLFNDLSGVSDMGELISYELRKGTDDFLALYPDCAFKTLEELVKFNEDHASEELPDYQSKQDSFYDMLSSKMTQERFSSGLSILRKAARSGIDKALSENDIDAILGPSDGMFASMASAAGYPVASMPLGFAKFNGRAFGVQVLAKAGAEDKILRVMSAWEATFPGNRQPPQSLVK